MGIRINDVGSCNTRLGLCYIYNRGEPYNSIVHIFSSFVKSFMKLI